MHEHRHQGAGGAPRSVRESESAVEMRPLRAALDAPSRDDVLDRSFDDVLEMARRENATLILPATGINEAALRTYLAQRGVPMVVMSEAEAARERNVFQLVLVREDA
jgi:dihydropteroate synthase